MKKVTINETKITNVPVEVSVEEFISVTGWACSQNCNECGWDIESGDKAVMALLEGGRVRHFHQSCFNK